MRFPVVVEIGSSRRLRAALVFAHAAAGAALALADMPPAAALAGFLLLAVSLGYRWRPPPPAAYRLGDDGVLSRIDGADEPLRLDILPGGLALVSLVVVRVRAGEGKRRSTALVVLPDSLPAADFRMLRLWLRWRARFSPRGAAA
ncbi:MAG: hypothetical protein H3C26_00740 [Rhodocyclaceae bacterium]|nr:hypothetical protein [Rhodocyclaceae bacterium]